MKRKRKKQRRTGRLATSLTTPPSVQRLQTALHDKAVTFFHALSGLYSVIAPTTSAVFSPQILAATLANSSLVLFENSTRLLRTKVRSTISPVWTPAG